MFRITLVMLVGSLPGFAEDLTAAPPATPPASGRCAPAIACAAPLPSTQKVTVLAGSDGRDGDGQLVHAGQMSITYALDERVQFNFVSNTLVLLDAIPQQANGVQPGLKLSLNQETTWGPSTALSLHLTVPTWAGAQTWDFEGWWYFSKRFAAVQADLNLMVTVTDLMGSPSPQGLATLTVSTDLGRGVGLFGEAWATWGQTQARPPGAGLFAGVSFTVGLDLAIDAGSELAVHQNGPVVTVFGGLTWSPRARHRALPRPEALSTHAVSDDLGPGFELISLSPDPVDLPLRRESLLRPAAWSR